MVKHNFVIDANRWNPAKIIEDSDRSVIVDDACYQYDTHGNTLVDAKKYAETNPVNDFYEPRRYIHRTEFTVKEDNYDRWKTLCNGSPYDGEVFFPFDVIVDIYGEGRYSAELREYCKHAIVAIGKKLAKQYLARKGRCDTFTYTYAQEVPNTPFLDKVKNFFKTGHFSPNVIEHVLYKTYLNTDEINLGRIVSNVKRSYRHELTWKDIEKMDKYPYVLVFYIRMTQMNLMPYMNIYYNTAREDRQDG